MLVWQNNVLGWFLNSCRHDKGGSGTILVPSSSLWPPDEGSLGGVDPLPGHIRGAHSSHCVWPWCTGKVTSPTLEQPHGCFQEFIGVMNSWQNLHESLGKVHAQNLPTSHTKSAYKSHNVWISTTSHISNIHNVCYSILFLNTPRAQIASDEYLSEPRNKASTA